jgi:1,2-diacylglycerol 3-alpha-glucosyltransferase
MVIGIVTVWFERGASYVSRQYQKLLEANGNKVFIFARGGILAKDDPAFNSSNVTWADPTYVPIGGSFDLEMFKKWLKDKEIEIVFFNEQTWLDPVILCHDLGIKTGAYIDYYTNKTVPFFRVYDFLICNTRKHYSVFSEFEQCFYVPWGTETELFRPVSTKLLNKDFVTFFHSCGFSPERKGTDILIAAFSKLNIPCKLIIHSQVDLKKKLRHQRDIIDKLVRASKIEIINETVGAPGLYHLGDVYVYPTRLEGIGLTIAEALSCGLPVIVPDNGPMNEFVNDCCGSFARVSKYYKRKDDYYWDMCETDIKSLSDILEYYARNRDLVQHLKQGAREHAIKHLNWDLNKKIVNDIFLTTKMISGMEKSIIISKIRREEYLNRGSLKYRVYKVFPLGYKVLNYLRRSFT